MKITNDKISKLVKKYEKDLLEDLAKLVAIPSISCQEEARKLAPFGEQVKIAFDVYAQICNKLNFVTKNCDGYAIYAQTGDKEEYIAAIGHLDVVDAGDLSLWESDPYAMRIENGILYGRGVNDDKGPLLAALYALKIVNDLGVVLKHDVRIIAGGAEETTWECMKYYFQHHPQPLLGFSPDGNFPIVNGEKGILQFHYKGNKKCMNNINQLVKIICNRGVNFVCEEIIIEIVNCNIEHIKFIAKKAKSLSIDKGKVTIVYQGKSALSRNPQKGENALWKFAQDFKNFIFAQSAINRIIQILNKYFVEDYTGTKLGIDFTDLEMGNTSICPMSIIETEEDFRLMIDYRYVNGVDIEEIKKILIQKGEEFHMEMGIDKKKRMLYVEENSHLIQSLKKAYATVMNEEATLFTKGGASYARVMDHGVAFGATFENEDPCCHMPNENMPIASLLKACEIYVYAFLEMDKVSIESSL